MSLLDPRPSVETVFKIKPTPEYRGSDVALLGTRLWNSLSPENDSERLYVSATSNRHHGPGHDLRAISFWAVPDEQTEDLAVPSTWLTVYPRVFSRNTPGIALKLLQPMLLTELVVTALSPEAYEVGPSALDSWLCSERRVLRQGDICTFTSDSLVNGSGVHNNIPLQYRLDMLEPVTQGYGVKGETKIILTLDIPAEQDVADSDSDAEGFEIDERFLAPTHIGSPSQPSENRPVAFECGAMAESESQLYEECTLYLRTVDLGRVGGFNGDWVVVHSPGSSNRRLVRVLADDSFVQSNGRVQGSPVLLHNICPVSPSQPARTLSLDPSPFGSGQPVIPTAKAITIARVASPVSVDRAYQPAFLRSLKNYFSHSKRLVKHGDLIAVGINSDTPLDETEETQDVDQRYMSPQRTDQVIFFLITNIEHDVMPRAGQISNRDAYLDSTMGEMGCWIDPAVTRIIQTGVEHCRVPDVGTYFHPDGNSPRAVFAILNGFEGTTLLRPSGPYGRLIALCSATWLPDAVDYDLHLSVLLKGARGTGKFTTACWVAQRMGMHMLEINCYDLIGENDTKTEGILRARFEKVEECSPCILLLRYIDGLAQTTQVLETGKESVLTTVLRECIENVQNSWRISGYPVMVFATTAEAERVPMGILSCFKHEVTFEAPSEGERHEILRTLVAGTVLAPDVSLSKLATETAALVAGDIASLVQRAESVSISRASRILNSSETDVMNAGIAITAADFETALEKARVAYSESIGAPKIPNVSWDDVGGLAAVKSDILDTIQLPLEHPELFADGLKKRSGILLYGPPGTGKTLLAKAVATSCALNFFSVKGPELLNMYIGESEANVRRVFQRARDAKPCVIFFDELDSVAPKRGNHGDSGGVMDRIVSQLLAELDGMAGGSGADVFVIGATNRPDLLDPALLRPGRFDRMLYLGVSDTHAAQHNILQALTRKFRLDPALDLAALAEQCPFNYTGADFYALCSDAMLNAMSRKAEALEAKLAVLNSQPSADGHPRPLTAQYYLAELAEAEDIEVLVSHTDFERALANLVPSVSQSEMDHYAHIQQRFSRPPDEEPGGHKDPECVGGLQFHGAAAEFLAAGRSGRESRGEEGNAPISDFAVNNKLYAKRRPGEVASVDFERRPRRIRFRDHP
ncbi:AAA-domain-containing protein [Mycena maculata]|uniref:Peroxisomal ATPase PEX6 n=1 Tax=Mycena maculata TaxID=230809 RepID=A0AAD7I4F4_9AGAR|nr:AAA-domain-containing protein [Mycena maculata]